MALGRVKKAVGDRGSSKAMIASAKLERLGLSVGVSSMCRLDDLAEKKG